MQIVLRREIKCMRETIKCEGEEEKKYEEI